MLQALFFDAVGTLLFPAEPVAETYRRIGADFGIELPLSQVETRFRAAFAVQEQFDHDLGNATSEDHEYHRWRAIVRETLGESADAAGCFRALYEHFARPTGWRVHPDAGRAFRQAERAGLRLGIGSNFDARLIGLVDSLAELEPLRGRVVVSSQVGYRKPHRQFFRRVVDVAGCEPDRILFVGDDRRNDLEGATAAGLQARLVTRAFLPGDEAFPSLAAALAEFL